MSTSQKKYKKYFMKMKPFVNVFNTIWTSAAISVIQLCRMTEVCECVLIGFWYCLPPLPSCFLYWDKKVHILYFSSGKHVIFFVISDVDSVLLRMTIVGVLLSFRQLSQEALLDVSSVYEGMCWRGVFAIEVLD